ncbi:hypothetical protein SMICM304S_05756 [Streptomyces microflavus]
MPALDAGDAGAISAPPAFEERGPGRSPETSARPALEDRAGYGAPTPPYFSPRKVSRNNRPANSGSSADCSAANAIAFVSCRRSSIETSARTAPLSCARNSPARRLSRTAARHWANATTSGPARPTEPRTGQSAGPPALRDDRAASQSPSARHGASAPASSLSGPGVSTARPGRPANIRHPGRGSAGSQGANAHARLPGDVLQPAGIRAVLRLTGRTCHRRPRRSSVPPGRAARSAAPASRAALAILAIPALPWLPPARGSRVFVPRSAIETPCTRMGPGSASLTTSGPRAPTDDGATPVPDARRSGRHGV